jgi:hypothetical protein
MRAGGHGAESAVALAMPEGASDISVATHVLAIRRYGWPWPALDTTDVIIPEDTTELFYSRRSGSGPPAWWFESWRSGVWHPLDPGRGWATAFAKFPCMPHWPTMAADSAFHAGLWFLILTGFVRFHRFARSRFRISRGMCGSCGYDLKGSPGGVCPECGANS